MKERLDMFRKVPESAAKHDAMFLRAAARSLGLMAMTFDECAAKDDGMVVVPDRMRKDLRDIIHSLILECESIAGYKIKIVQPMSDGKDTKEKSS